MFLANRKCHSGLASRFHSCGSAQPPSDPGGLPTLHLVTSLRSILRTVFCIFLPVPIFIALLNDLCLSSRYFFIPPLSFPYHRPSPLYIRPIFRQPSSLIPYLGVLSDLLSIPSRSCICISSFLSFFSMANPPPPTLHPLLSHLQCALPGRQPMMGLIQPPRWGDS